MTTLERLYFSPYSASPTQQPWNSHTTIKKPKHVSRYTLYKNTIPITPRILFHSLSRSNSSLSAPSETHSTQSAPTDTTLKDHYSRLKKEIKRLPRNSTERQQKVAEIKKLVNDEILLINPKDKEKSPKSLVDLISLLDIASPKHRKQIIETILWATNSKNNPIQPKELAALNNYLDRSLNAVKKAFKVVYETPRSYVIYNSRSRHPVMRRAHQAMNAMTEVLKIAKYWKSDALKYHTD